MTTAPPPTPPSPPPVDPPPWAAPPPPSPPPHGPQLTARPPLRRSATNRVLGGVAGGLAEYSGIDALIWRVGFIALTVAGGSGIAVYLLLWVLTPAASAQLAGAPAPAHGRGRRQPSGPRSRVPRLTVAALLIVVGTLALLNLFTPLTLGPRAFLGSALLIVGLGLVAAGLTGGRTARGGLIALGAVLSMTLLSSEAEPWHGHSRHVGDRTYHPTTAAEVLRTYDVGIPTS